MQDSKELIHWMEFPIDLGRYHTEYGDLIDQVRSDYEHNVIHQLADQIIKIQSPHYFHEDGHVDEDAYDDWADVHMAMVEKLGNHIFGRQGYTEYSTK